MEDRLRYLLPRHLRGELTQAETDEFLRLAGREENRAWIRAEITRELNRSSAEEADDELGQTLYAGLLAQHGIRKETTVRRLLRIGSRAAAVLVIIGLIWIFFPKQQAGRAPYRPETQLTYRNKNLIRLPDGSTVLLRNNSELTVISRNGQFTREVMLKGEAFFDIAHRAGRRFVVHTGTVRTEVLGTAFQIRTVDGKVDVAVTRGLVEVRDDGKVLGRLHPKEQIRVVSAREFNISASPELSGRATEPDPLVFEEETLAEAFNRIGKKFNREIFLENPQMGRCRISARFDHDESLDDILSTLCEMRQSTYTTERDNVLIRGGISCR